jgi:hypothetical protein
MTKDENTCRDPQAQRERFPSFFQFAHGHACRRFGTVRRPFLIALVVLSSIAPLRAESPAKFASVAIDPASANLYIATVSMAFQPFVRKGSEYSSAYVARVFPFFYTERGRIWIVMPDDLLRRVDRGEAVDFTGRALNDSGDSRKVEGHAVPTGPMTGKIRVRVYVSRRISLTYDTTYELKGPASPSVTATAVR